MVNKCTFRGRKCNFNKTKNVGGYEILTCCTDCEGEIESNSCRLGG